MVVREEYTELTLLSLASGIKVESTVRPEKRSKKRFIPDLLNSRVIKFPRNLENI